MLGDYINDLYVSFRSVMENASIFTQLFLSLAIVLISVLLTRLAATYYRRETKSSPEARRIAYLAVRNSMMVVSSVVILMIWAGELRHFALSLAALAAAVAIASKEFVMSALGSFLRSVQRLYSVGDVIEINGLRGEVIEINFFTTVMLEQEKLGFLTGRYQEFPNMLLLLHSVRKIVDQGLYGLEQVRIPLDPSLDDILVKEQLLLQAGREICENWIEEAVNHFRRLETRFMIGLPEGRPTTFLEPIDAKRVDIVLRFPCPNVRRMTIAQDIYRRYFRLVAGSENKLIE